LPKQETLLYTLGERVKSTKEYAPKGGGFYHRLKQ